MPISSSAMRLIMRQIQEIQDNPTDGIRLYPTDDLSKLFFDITGPEETPFAGGLFTVVLCLEDHYPATPPRGFFRTKIFHPNISEKGEICVNVLRRDWRAALGLRHVLRVVRCLLIEPNAESALNEEAGRLLLEDFGAFRRKAAMMTKVHARRTAHGAAEREGNAREREGEGEREEEGGEKDNEEKEKEEEKERGKKEGEVGEEEEEEEEEKGKGKRERNDVRNVEDLGMRANAGLRNASNSAVNVRGAESNGASAASTALSKKALEKKRAALKRI